MNKKMIVMMVLTVFVCNCFVFAAQGNGNSGNNDLVNGLKNAYENQEQNQAQYRQQSKVQGLERARLRVRNEEQAQQLEQVMIKIDENRKEMLNNLNNLEVGFEDSKIRAEGEGQAKFLGLLKVQKQFKYRISNEGEVFQVRNLWDKLFKE